MLYCLKIRSGNMEYLRLTPKDDIGKEINDKKNPCLIYLEKGEYRQKIEIKRSGVTVTGAGDETKIIFGDYAKKIHADGKEYNTFRTYTLCVSADGVTLKNLSVVNSNTEPETVGQCVALSVNGNNFYGESLNLVSTQDTLFLSPFPDDLVIRYAGFIPQNQLYCEGKRLHLFRNCRISGNVDFIFGCSEAYFKDCRIISIADKRGYGFVAAPAHPLAEDRGFSFIGCEFVSDGADRASNFLARPWRDFGKCNFINCRIENHIRPELFDKWNDTERDRTARFCYYNLDCGFEIQPVKWCRELSKADAEDIINDCERKFKYFNK